MTGNPKAFDSKLDVARRLMVFNEVMGSVLATRSRLFNGLTDPRRDMDKECGYPENVTREQYRAIYDRNGIATRVVEIFPNESWAMPPDMVETEAPDLTDFERTYHELDEQFMLNHYMERADVLSGIGHFGILVFGVSDGLELHEPVPGVEEGTPPNDLELLYVRAFDEMLVDVDEYETDRTNKRYGLPKTYSVTMFDPNVEAGHGVGRDQTRQKIHWTRVQHICDNRQCSEVFGRPRLKPVINHILDHRKVLSGSAEMFWRGGFYGYSFEADPTLGDITLDVDSIKKQFDDYGNGLSRYLAMAGGTVKPLASAVASPEYHDRCQLTTICAAIGVPMRVFIGSEEAKVSSTQDARTWHKRLHRRQTQYVVPFIIRPTIQRLQAYGILPPIKNGYKVTWPDLNTPTEEDRAAVAAKKTEAISKYMASGADEVIAPEQFFLYVMGEPYDRVKLIMEATEARIDAEETFADDLIERTPEPPAPVAPVGGAGRGGNGGGLGKARPAPKKPATGKAKPKKPTATR